MGASRLVADSGYVADAFVNADVRLTAVEDEKVGKRDQSVDAVSEFAVPANGTTDARGPLLSAFSATEAGRKVFIRRGSYLMTSRINTLKQGMIIEGEDPYSTTFLLNGAALEASVSDVLVKNVTFKGNNATTRQLFQSLASGGNKNWRFENCRFDGVGVVVARVGASSDVGTVLTSGTGHSEGVELDNCEFLNYTADGAFYSKGVDGVTVNRCHFHDIGLSSSVGDNCKISYGAKHFKLLHNRFERSTRDAIDCYDGNRGLIDGNTFSDIGVFAIEIKIASFANANPVDRIRVTKNHATRCQISSGSGATSPSMQLSGSHLIVSENIIEDTPGSGYRSGKSTDGATNNRDVSYIGNHAIGCAGPGFSALGVDRVTYLGNHSVGSTGGRGYDVGSLNTSVVGGSTLNQSAGNAYADVWS